MKELSTWNLCLRLTPSGIYIFSSRTKAFHSVKTRESKILLSTTPRKDEVSKYLGFCSDLIFLEDITKVLDFLSQP